MLALLAFNFFAPAVAVCPAGPMTMRVEVAADARAPVVHRSLGHTLHEDRMGKGQNGRAWPDPDSADEPQPSIGGGSNGDRDHDGRDRDHSRGKGDNAAEASSDTRETRQTEEKGSCSASLTTKEVVVHYEALCPDSVAFFKNPKGWAAAWQDSTLRKTYTFIVVPYGNVQLASGSSWGGRSCQHGERECYGNAWQTCAQTVVTDQANLMGHINCLMDLPKSGMGAHYWLSAAWSCGSYYDCVVSQCSANITDVEKSSIKSCVSNIKGGTSCAGSTKFTAHQRSASSCGVNHVPWVIVNGMHQDAIDEDKVKLVDYLNTAKLLVGNSTSTGWVKTSKLVVKPTGGLVDQSADASSQSAGILMRKETAAGQLSP